MQSKQRIKVLCASIVVGGVILSACGGSTKSSSFSSAALGGSSSTTSAAPTQTTVKATDSGNFCSKFAAYRAEVKAYTTGLSTPGANLADDIKTFAQATSQFYPALLTQLPSSERPDLQTLITASNQYYAALAAVGYNPTKLPASASSILTAPKVTAAEAALKSDGQGKTLCGVSEATFGAGQ